MRRILLVSSIALMAMNMGLYAQEKDTTQGESKVEVKVVYEKTFDEPIVDVIFDTATVSIDEAKKMGWKEDAFSREDKAKGKILISYPKVVFVSQGRELDWYVPERRSSYYTKEIKFYDKNGKIINKIILKDSEEYIHLSPQNKYVLVSRMPTEWNPNYSGGTLYDLDGKKIWEIEGPSPIAVSDEGYAIAANLDWDVPPKLGGDFYVYDSKGKLLTTIENPLKEKTAPLFAEYSKDGDYAILNFIKPTYPPTAFVLITKEGKIMWKKELPEYRFSARYGCIEQIEILPYKGVGLADGFFIDWQGDLKWKQSLNAGANRGCIFSQDKQKFYIYGAKGRLYSLNVDTGGIIWEHAQHWSPADKVFWFVEMYELNQHIVMKGEPNKVFLFDSNTGKLKKEIEYPDKKIYLSPHSGKIFVINVTDKKIEGLKIEEE